MKCLTFVAAITTTTEKNVLCSWDLRLIVQLISHEGDREILQSQVHVSTIIFVGQKGKAHIMFTYYIKAGHALQFEIQLVKCVCTWVQVKYEN